jgi:hypothetical protein
MQRHHAAAVLIALLSALALPGCGEPPQAPPDLSVFNEGAQVYSVRGEVVQLPAKGPPPQSLKIHHEHIPEFVGKTGAVHINSDGVPGMKAMVMEFPEIAPGVSLDGFKPGDRVAFEMKVKWTDSPGGVKTARWLVSAIERLPEGTELSFENKAAPAGAPGADGP